MGTRNFQVKIQIVAKMKFRFTNLNSSQPGPIFRTAFSLFGQERVKMFLGFANIFRRILELSGKMSVIEMHFWQLRRRIKRTAVPLFRALMLCAAPEFPNLNPSDLTWALGQQHWLGVRSVMRIARSVHSVYWPTQCWQHRVPHLFVKSLLGVFLWMSVFCKDYFRIHTKIH